MSNSVAPAVLKRLEQVVMEDQYSRRGIRSRVRDDIINLKETMKATFAAYERSQLAISTWANTETYYNSKLNRMLAIRAKDPEDIVLEVIIAASQCLKPTPIQAVAASLAHQLELSEIYDDPFAAVLTAGEILAVCAKEDLLNIHMPGSTGEYITVTCKVTITQDTRDFISKTRYLNPMLIQPDDWIHNSHGGYLTINESVLLGSETHHREVQALDALNIAQSVEWELDEHIVSLQEKPSKPFKSQDEARAFQDMVRISQSVYDELLDAGNEFYFTWRFDFRGRMYSSGYHVNLQASDYKKSLLNFAKRQPVTTEVN